MLSSLDFDWPKIRLALEGLSIIDFPRLNINSKTEATQFLLSYGLNPDDPAIKEEIWRVYFEAISFLRNHLLEEGEALPNEFLERNAQNDIRKLLVEISSSSGRSKWVCPILRIMHIIIRLDNDIRLEYFQHARDQIFSRFDNLIQQTGPKQWLFGQNIDDGIRLVRFLKKQRKERNSTIMKLLSKPQADVEAIYDSLGLKFVTENKLDAFRLVQAMFDHGAISLSHIQPSRSQNNLMPINSLVEFLDDIKDDLESGKLSIKAAQKKLLELEQFESVSVKNMKNPYSSPWYRAIQFTCRQLIRAPDNTFNFWSDVKNQLEEMNVLKEFQKNFPIVLREEKRFFYPFEIQIVDKESYVESIRGRSRHRIYKDKQRVMARNRVLRDLI